MKIIALDSSGLVAGVAVWEDGILRAEYTTNYKKTHSQTLLPMLEELRDMLELDLDTVDAIAVASGPGSFTGLRIGAATAKGLGLALDKPLVEVPTLEGMAYNLWGTERLVCPMMDARRSQVYTGIYEFVREGQELKLGVVRKQCAADINDILMEINVFGREVIFLGDGADAYRDVIREKTKVPYSFAPAQSSHQRAASVAALGAVYFAQGKTVTAAEHRPEYLRQSQAQEDRS
ncbi:MAG: tRNA (adenosine(37)-N6)-threonylcarbamoyltransferase complex dimerization subunit type 1 TsaB [Acetatifactor sp.]|nr:tRNA (adenosine(37)-N6)-threonylcarbamoyltransferase complex dimerization subunit type 1 TsaB [Acetatifactor sp.]